MRDQLLDAAVQLAPKDQDVRRMLDELDLLNDFEEDRRRELRVLLQQRLSAAKLV